MWADARELRSDLEATGWRTPDTYCRFFDEPKNRPAVYLFLLWDQSTLGMSDAKAFVAYVGQSTKLAQRWAGHAVLAEISRLGFWPQRWFRPTERERLRPVELALIQRFEPPWNIQGRKRGVVLQ